VKSRAIVFNRPGEASFDSIEISPPKPGQIQIRTLFSTISVGTEGWILQDRFTWHKTPFPCVPGYERVGVITALGEGVSGWTIGERVAATVSDWDGDCKPFNGSHAELSNTWAGEVYRLTPEIDDVDAASLVVAQVGYNAAYRPALNEGQTVVVYGDGIIGQCAAQAARSRGARVILVGHRKERLELGARFSADLTIDNGKTNVAEAVRKFAGAEHVAVVLDSVQTETAQNEYMPLLQNGRGQIVYCGFTPGNVWADMGALQRRELTTHYIAGWSRPRMEATLGLMASRKMHVRPLLTHLVPCRRGAEMYRMTLSKHEPFLGITLDWESESK
jgi:2-desacetyl-2-hydroxyethyl bacteriochlorophyllide A dehydrogenase